MQRCHRYACAAACPATPAPALPGSVQLQLSAEALPIVILVTYVQCIFVSTVLFQSVFYVINDPTHYLLSFLPTWWQRCEEEPCTQLAYRIGTDEKNTLSCFSNQG